MLMCAVAVGSIAPAQPAQPADALCAQLLDARRIAESQGRLDFSAVVEAAGNGGAVNLTPHVRMGSAYAVGRINFTGHRAINDSTLRRAMALRERDVFDVGKLRRSLAQLNDTGLIEPLTIADIVVTRNSDRVTADVTIPLRERGRRWWSLSGPVIPGLGSYHASISSRLPAWGRGIIDASTYYATFNLLGLARPLLGVLPLVSKSPPTIVALERPYLPGQGLLSGFALSPELSARSTLAHYGRTQLSRIVRAMLDETSIDSLAVPITGSGQAAGELLVCNPPKPRLWWLRRGAIQATDLALAALLP
jgi:Surface antigen variable number repeat